MFELTRRHLLNLAAGTAATAFVPTAWAAATLRPIEEEGFVRIGGIDQWVAIRGRDRSRTPMLFLHGGPCEAESPFLSLFAPREERYVVAQWDQRGTGRTFRKSGTPTNMTMEQLTQDAIEVTRYVLSRLKAHKLILIGFSWGAELGLNVIRSKPELFHAFVGTGQPISGRDTFEHMRSSAVDRAEAAGDAQAVTQLKRFTVSDFADMTNRNSCRIPLNSTPERAATTYRYLTLSFRAATTLDAPRGRARIREPGACASQEFYRHRWRSFRVLV